MDALLPRTVRRELKAAGCGVFVGRENHNGE